MCRPFRCIEAGSRQTDEFSQSLGQNNGLYPQTGIMELTFPIIWGEIGRLPVLLIISREMSPDFILKYRKFMDPVHNRGGGVPASHPKYS
ncbi:Uncharacterised protein [Enterobacter hormaechei]|nr:Uncharacterised protein [Enterobacter hormaechei]